MSTRIPTQSRLIRVGPYWDELARADVPWERFGGRELGAVVTDHASSWVRRLATPARAYFIKTYEYITWARTLRAVTRYTGPHCRSRAAREFDALNWYGAHLPHGVEPVAALEQRRFGFVRRAILVTAAWPGEPVDLLLARLEPGARTELAAAIGRFVDRIHAQGARDGNLDLRNLIARHDGEWRIAKIDSPRFRLRPPGRSPDRLTARDWARLVPQLDAFGVGPAARQPGGGLSSSSVTV